VVMADRRRKSLRVSILFFIGSPPCSSADRREESLDASFCCPIGSPPGLPGSPIAFCRLSGEQPQTLGLGPFHHLLPPVVPLPSEDLRTSGQTPTGRISRLRRQREILPVRKLSLNSRFTVDCPTIERSTLSASTPILNYSTAPPLCQIDALCAPRDRYRTFERIMRQADLPVVEYGWTPDHQQEDRLWLSWPTGKYTP